MRPRSRPAFFALGAAILHLLLPSPAGAQHQHSAPADTMAMEGVLGVPMERMGSGTSWVPDAVPLPARHFMRGDWMFMAHGFVFGQYTAQSGRYGASQLGSLNWAMIMADHPLAGGRIQLRFMPSLDPWTVGPCGYPLLLQSGETCRGEPLVDWQHPHDFFMELGALYERPLGSRVALLLYAAPAGEPALGPVAFMHRPSAMDEPQVPLGHHWQDVTHTSFGVVTAGLFTKTVRVEGSVFNGHEPDEQRWNLEPVRLNSWSGRVTVNPTVNWSFSGSYGYQKDPEPAGAHAQHSGPIVMRKASTSAMYGRRLSERGQWAGTLLYGVVRHPGQRWSNSLLAEAEASIDRNTFFGRLEYVEKSAEDLQIHGFPSTRKFVVESASLGYIRDLLSASRPFAVGIGARGTINLVSREVGETYGSRTPFGGMVFVRLRPNNDAPHH